MAEIGHHKGYPQGATTKNEISALLCRAGVEAGFWAIPEYEIDTSKGKQSIDVVWALRTEQKLPRIWHPVAAFEVEGWGVNGSVPKDVISLDAACRQGAVIAAIVLFQIGRSEMRKPNPQDVSVHEAKMRLAEAKVKKRLEEAHNAYESSHPMEVVLDLSVDQVLNSWIERCRTVTASE